MNNPDFSQSAEHVALANAMVDVLDDEKPWASVLGYDDIYRMADAAITHLGSGYRLPEATDANSERLAREYTRIVIGRPQDDPGWVKDATNYLRALHAAFGAPGPDSPADPTFCRPGCDRKFGHLGPHSDEGPDFAAEAAERERQRLLEAFMHDLVSNPAVMAKLEGNADAVAAWIRGVADALAQELIG